MADITPYHFPGDTVTCHAEAAVTGGRAIIISGPRVDDNYQVSPAGANAARILGVASRDKAAGEKVMAFTDPGTVVDGEAGAAVTANDPLATNANGAFVPAEVNPVVALALDDIANGARGPVRLL